MATRNIQARLPPVWFAPITTIYNHWDGYPEGAALYTFAPSVTQRISFGRRFDV